MVIGAPISATQISPQKSDAGGSSKQVFNAIKVTVRSEFTAFPPMCPSGKTPLGKSIAIFIPEDKLIKSTVLKVSLKPCF